MLRYSDDLNKEYHVGLKKGDVGDYIIMPGDPKRCVKIAAYLDDAELIADNREFMTYTGYLNGTKVSVVSSGIGGPSAAIAMEELCNIGAKVFIRVGTCGGIKTTVKSGDAVIAHAAVRMDGTSKEYAPIEYPAVSDYYLTEHLVQAAKRLGIRHHCGVVQCKDSFYGQHNPEASGVSHDLLYKWEAWKRLGVLASEMESSTLFVVGALRRVRVASIFLTVANQEREKLGLENPIVKDIDIPIRIAIEALKDIIEEDKTIEAEEAEEKKEVIR